MKVLFVSSGNSASNSVDNLTLSQGRSLTQQGIELDYYTIKGKGIKGYYKNINPLKEQLRKKKYDIIHAHYGLCGILSSFARSNEKLIVSFMGDDLLGSVSNSGNYSVKSRIISFLNKLFGRFAYDHCIVKSQNLYNQLISNKNVSIIPNGVNYDVFFPYNKEEARTKLHMTDKKKIVLFVADTERPEKNYKLAKEAIQRIDNPDIHLIAIKNIPQDQLNDHYNAADVLLLTSTHEGSPNVIKEAMACDLPIVSTDVGDVKKNIGQTQGCYVTSMDKIEIASKITEVLKLNSRTQGRKDLEHLKIEKVAEQIVTVYKLVLCVE
jgi:teichuronic acid biosynthesis glycosyltransferase TuaC